jgi:signal transduction histidine kinase
LRIVVAAVALAGFLLALALALMLVRQILNPIAQLLAATFSGGAVRHPDNVVAALSQSVEGLIQNVDQTQSELARSREYLLQAEKMAVVGKLAAGMAHSIRNPFTSVKMRLFSLARTLRMTPAQKEDFDVISEEIRHIDTIVQNFLEFSRPPKLVMQSISISTIVDNTLQLLSHRLKSYDVTIELSRPYQLPLVQADPEQLKEVLVNLMVNACEAFEQHGGRIRIEEKVVKSDGRRQVMVRLSDSGPGIDPDLGEQVFQPFITTKEDGTGLGLSIAQRIVDEHGGRLKLESAPGQGAIFVIILPTEDIASEYDTDCR